MRFTKMHGIGNDYLFINCFEEYVPDPARLVLQMCREHTGVGGDGIVLLEPADSLPFAMRIFNRDGSEAEMCGNAARCIGKYLYENHLTNKTKITLETLSGIKTIQINLDSDGNIETISVDMGKSKLLNIIGLGGSERTLKGEKIESCGRKFMATAIDMGNPHLVLFVPDAEQVDVTSIGSELEFNPMFPNRANIEFAQIIDRSHIRMRVWERGSGITQACGTGACATAVAAAMADLTNADCCYIQMDGGTLQISYNTESHRVIMTGTATKVFEGEIEI